MNAEEVLKMAKRCRAAAAKGNVWQKALMLEQAEMHESYAALLGRVAEAERRIEEVREKLNYAFSWAEKHDGAYILASESLSILDGTSQADGEKGESLQKGLEDMGLAFSDTSPEDRQPAKVRVSVRLKQGIIDLEGQAVRDALKMRTDDVQDVRTGKWFEIVLVENPGSNAMERLENITREVLANPVIEEAEFQPIPKDQPAPAETCRTCKGTEIEYYPEAMPLGGTEMKTRPCSACQGGS